MASGRRSLLFITALSVLLISSLVAGKDFEGLGDDSEEEFSDGDVEVEVPAGIPQKVHRVVYKAQVDDDEADSEGDQPTVPSGTVPLDSPENKKPAKQAVKDDWDEEEFEGIEKGYPEQPSAAKPAAKQAPVKPKVRVVLPRKPMKAKDHIPEMIFLVFLVLFAINYFWGSKTNEKIALAWAEEFATSANSIFAKNFSLLGTGDSNDEKEPLMIKEGQGVFKFYASGRRFCECALATIELRSRHDLLSLAWYLVFPRKDTVKIEVHMNEESMQPFILAVVRRKVGRTYLKENKDLREYCSIIDYSNVQKNWPQELAVISDSREAISELLNDVILEQLLGEKAFEKFAKAHFVSLHFTDQGPGPLKKKILRFEFSLPSLGKMADMTKLVASVPYFIDAVARFNLSSNAKTKADAARSKAQQSANKELEEQKKEELQRRKEEKRKAEEAKMTPQELARKREKEQKKQMKPKGKMMRIH